MLPKLFFISILFSFIFITHSCLHHQKILLLQLKDELSFDSSRSTKLVRWNESDECCKWPGVECDAAGYVVSLQLDDESISGGIADSSSLFRLVHLQKLNLAFNNFNNIPIPKGIHNLTYLTHLNLSNARFVRQVPAEIFSLRRLVSLDISYNTYRGYLSLEYPNLEMLVQNLTELRELYLDFVIVTSSHERRKWSHIISSYLPNLTTLSLVDCGLSGPLAKSFWQLHSLSILRLDHNNLGPELPDLFANFPSLTTLSLYDCSLKGSIPSTFANLTNLIRVDLSGNSFTGSLSSTLFEGLSNLVYLNLWHNSFSGNIPHSLFALPSLLELDLSNNQFNGTLQLDNFPSLVNLDLSHNRLSSVDVGNVNSTSYGSHQLKELRIASCNLSHFPNFIKHSDDLRTLDLSYNRIGGEIPSWIWGAQLEYLYLSYNLLTDVQKPYHIPASLVYLNLHSNQLKGELYLPIQPASQLSELLLANNSLSGSIPTSFCSATHLSQLEYLSGNKLSGGIPPCLLERNIGVINLGRNNISGSIPDNFPKDCSLYYLDLNNNTLQGKIPKSLESCELLQFLNLSYNKLVGEIPNRGRLQTFSADSFKGNPQLCSLNLNIICNRSDGNDSSHENADEEKEIEWGYISAALGYALGLGSIFWLLLLSQTFREKYFKKVDEIAEEIFDARIRRRRRRHARRVARNQVRRH
ncbi:receptor-like protein 7 [Salvia miltiorrhiza]|uniref:receptor-like protein 7 n=1 Tax=Salvia miltiorrhiza TaxID=226208 RepID=UPI0025ACC97F|nr:receptor-like protein 7 [Salvia miltiorrhiza]